MTEFFWTEEEKRLLKELYPNNSNKYIASVIGRSEGAITYMSKALGIKKDRGYLSKVYKLNSTKYNVNQDFFKKWTPNMSYILGFIYADGCVMDNNTSKRLKFGLRKKDGELVQKVLDCMESNHKVTNYRKHFKEFVIVNKEIYNDLRKLGVTPRKTFTRKFPDIPDVFVSHFVRGYFDGNGSITFRKRNIYLNHIRGVNNNE
ncbi:MAG: hypothetical protein ACE5KT_02705 [Methanosarcinales archaeon]